MSRSVCFYFQVHQPYRLRTYRFFDIGKNSYYYDDYTNKLIMNRIAEKSYLPMNKLLLKLIKAHKGNFKVSFSLSGLVIEQFKQYAPEVLESFRQLAKTGYVEFLSETYAHSLASVKHPEEFKKQVEKHKQLMQQEFGLTPLTFRNTELIYSDAIGAQVAEMGYNLMLTEGAKHILGWKSPNFMYRSAAHPDLKLLLKNYSLSDDIAFRFSNKGWSEWPLTADKFAAWVEKTDPQQQVINLFMDYETFGEHQWKDSGIFDFMEALPKAILKHTSFKFATPSELAAQLQPVSEIQVPYPISWADEERDLTAWLGNDLQDDAYAHLYKLEKAVNQCNNESISRDWQMLQSSDHFYYMCTKWFSDGDVHKYFNPYSNPYEAYINYMNVLADFTIRVEKASGTSFHELRSKAQEVGEQLGKIAHETTEKIKETARKGSKKAQEIEWDDLKELSNARIKKMLREVEMSDLAKAMRGAEEELTERIIPNLGKKARAQYEKAQENLGKIKKSDILKYRKDIEDRIKNLF